MSAPIACGPCGHLHPRPTSVLDEPHRCPECCERICGWCGEDLAFRRSQTIFCDSSCRANGTRWRQGGTDATEKPLKTAASHPLDDVRAHQETTELDEQLGQVIHQAIIDLIERTGEAHADDLEPYYPEGHRERCRSLQPGRFGSLRSRGYISKREERKSRFKSRNGAGSGVYVFTKKGREKLARTSSANREGTAVGIGGTLDRPAPLLSGDCTGARSSGTAGPGEDSPQLDLGEAA